jgi:hypothetical protein
MRRSRQLMVLTLMVVALPLSACEGSDEAAPSGNEPARIEPVQGSDRGRIILTAKAADRLDIQTVPVGEAKGKTVIPYAAVLYDPNGETWAYTSPQPLVFIREPIAVDRIVGDQAFLLDGPPSGTAVVTVGVVELYGTELGIE